MSLYKPLSRFFKRLWTGSKRVAAPIGHALASARVTDQLKFP